MTSSSTASPSTWWNCGVCVGVVCRAGRCGPGRRRTAAAARSPSRATASATCACAAPAVARRRRTCPTPAARGCCGRVVERVEVVVDEVDLRPLGDPEAEAEEDVLDLAPGRGQQVQAADRRDRRAGQRDVDAVGGQPGVELRRPRAPRGARPRSASSAWRASLAAGRPRRAPRAAARRRRAAGSAARPCGRGSATRSACSRSSVRRRAGDRGLAVGAQLGDPSTASCTARNPTPSRTGRPSPPSRR